MEEKKAKKVNIIFDSLENCHTGKTSIVKFFRGLPFDPDEPPTILDQFGTIQEENTQKWESYKGTEYRKVMEFDGVVKIGGMEVVMRDTSQAIAATNSYGSHGVGDILMKKCYGAGAMAEGCLRQIAMRGWYVVFTFDITNNESFERLRYRIEEVMMREYVHGGFLVGNKSDLADQRKVSSMEAKELAEMYNLPYYEVSARTCEGLMDISRRLEEELQKEEEPKAPPSLDLGKASTVIIQEEGKKKRCSIM